MKLISFEFKDWCAKNKTRRTKYSEFGFNNNLVIAGKMDKRRGGRRFAAKEIFNRRFDNSSLPNFQSRELAFGNPNPTKIDCFADDRHCGKLCGLTFAQLRSFLLNTVVPRLLAAPPLLPSAVAPPQFPSESVPKSDQKSNSCALRPPLSPARPRSAWEPPRRALTRAPSLTDRPPLLRSLGSKSQTCRRSGAEGRAPVPQPETGQDKLFLQP